MTNEGLFCISTAFLISTSFQFKIEHTIVTRYCMHPVYVVRGAGMALHVGGPALDEYKPKINGIQPLYTGNGNLDGEATAGIAACL